MFVRMYKLNERKFKSYLSETDAIADESRDVGPQIFRADLVYLGEIKTVLIPTKTLDPFKVGEAIGKARTEKIQCTAADSEDDF